MSWDSFQEQGSFKDTCVMGRSPGQLPYPSKLLPSSRVVIGILRREEALWLMSLPSASMREHKSSQMSWFMTASWRPWEYLMSHVCLMSLRSLVTFHPLPPWGNINRLDLWESSTNLNSYVPSKLWWLCPIWRKQQATAHGSFHLCLRFSFLE